VYYEATKIKKQTKILKTRKNDQFDVLEIILFG